MLIPILNYLNFPGKPYLLKHDRSAQKKIPIMAESGLRTSSLETDKYGAYSIVRIKYGGGEKKGCVLNID